MRREHVFGKIRSLMERVENNMTPYQAYLNEQKWINEVYNMQKDEYFSRPEEFFNMMENVGDTRFMTFGYVTGAKLQKTIKKRNPATNRMKSYPDYSVFNREGEDEVAGVIKLTRWNLQFRKRKSITSMYNKQVDDINQIKTEFGLPISKRMQQQTRTAVEKGGNVEQYVGDREEYQGHKYVPFNIAKANKKSYYYPINSEGRIIRDSRGKMREISEKEILPYLEKNVSYASSIKALREMGKDDGVINSFIKKMNDAHVNFRYLSPEYSSFIYASASINGSKKGFINKNFNRMIDDVNVNPQDLFEIANKRYKIDSEQLPGA